MNQLFMPRVNIVLSSLVTTPMWEFYPIGSPAFPQRKGNSVLEYVFFKIVKLYGKFVMYRHL